MGELVEVQSWKILYFLFPNHTLYNFLNPIPNCFALKIKWNEVKSLHCIHTVLLILFYSFFSSMVRFSLIVTDWTTFECISTSTQHLVTGKPRAQCTDSSLFAQDRQVRICFKERYRRSLICKNSTKWVDF